MERKIIGYYSYTVVLTYLGMLSACVGIFFSIGGNYFLAVLLLMISGICDMFDGTVASTKKSRDENEKRFGIQIDSLSDLVSFGVFPAIFVYMISGAEYSVMAIACAYILAALIRLAYFNVLEEQRQSRKDNRKKSYLGVPVTTIALILPPFYMLFSNNILANTICFTVMLGLVAIGFIFPIEIRKPASVGKMVIIVIGVLEFISLFIFRGAV